MREEQERATARPRGIRVIAKGMSESCGAAAAVFRRVLFSSHLLCLELFLFFASSGQSGSLCRNHPVKARG
jgi:hypothetical protein